MKQDTFVRTWLVSLVLGLVVFAGFSLLVPEHYKIWVLRGLIALPLLTFVAYIFYLTIRWELWYRRDPVMRRYRAQKAEEFKQALRSLRMQLMVISGFVLVGFAGGLIAVPRADWPECFAAVFLVGVISWIGLRLYVQGRKEEGEC